MACVCVYVCVRAGIDYTLSNATVMIIVYTCGYSCYVARRLCTSQSYLFT